MVTVAGRVGVAAGVVVAGAAGREVDGGAGLGGATGSPPSAQAARDNAASTVATLPRTRIAAA
jgi:hypothetical protein